MADRFDDRILGEKDQYYYSSDEEDADDDASDDDGRAKTIKGPVVEPAEEEFKGGAATHTGPKGVIEDWRRFKQLETEKRQEKEVERLALAKHLALTCRSYLDDEKAKEDEKAEEDEMMMLGIDQEFLKQYREQRIREMTQTLQQNRPKFGKVIHLTKETFVDAIDKENNSVSVLIHIRSPSVPACEAMEGCLHCLAQEYPHVKFCSIYAQDVNLSQNFISNGLPALQIYKGGSLIGNFVRLSDQLGEDFFAGDLETFLQEHSHLPSKEEQQLIRGPEAQDSEDSDLELD
ncbi:phosducin-like protein [Patiria miniata]|uniref:Phosducin domain-containing protein n=1 Tax=Patiria miniata TaxID=46514 RepID=A0A914AUP2_PATMI|nr:phosducin-like protein [Patiria miniata]XP_038067393.1 phosducin-like protein [Patiria miniata]